MTIYQGVISKVLISTYQVVISSSNDDISRVILKVIMSTYIKGHLKSSNDGIYQGVVSNVLMTIYQGVISKVIMSKNIKGSSQKV